MKRLHISKTVAIAGAVTALVAAGGGSAVALAATTSSGNVYQACLSRALGTLYHVTVNASSAPKCLPRDTSVSWNQTGPQGPAGTFGTITVENQSNSIPADSEEGYTVTCPAGDVAVSGGSSFGPSDGTGLSTSVTDIVYVETSRPDPASGTQPTGWFVILGNSTSSTQTVNVYADCAAG
jgi:hypothetical protein